MCPRSRWAGPKTAWATELREMPAASDLDARDFDLVEFVHAQPEARGILDVSRFAHELVHIRIVFVIAVRAQIFRGTIPHGGSRRRGSGRCTRSPCRFR